MRFRACIIRAASLAAACVLFVSGHGNAVPAGSQNGNDLAAKVTIRRDTFGVPHILGETEEAAHFGLGYAMAEDHLLELARLFLKARSEEAAVFGEEFAEADLMTRTLRMYEEAAQGYAEMAPWLRSLLDAFSAGYNRYLDQHRSGLPDWVKPVSGVDLLAHCRRVIIMEFAMDLSPLRSLQRKQTGAASGGDGGALRGSNMWAIGKGRSASGNALLLANPHLSWSGSQIFYEAHMTVPGVVNISGTTLLGTPVIAIGFNENLGWSHTVNLHDADDFYQLTLDPADGGRYLYAGRSIALERRQIEVRVKKGSALETRRKEVFWSHYGPVLHREQGKAYAFKSANLRESRFLEQWNLMGKARTLKEFRSILDMQAIPMFNICYADRDGNIFYIFNGRFPERPAGYDWSRYVPGDTPATEWNRILPQARLPLLVNPPGGYVQNCNSSPWYTNLHALIDRHSYPEDLTPNFNDLRSQLSLEMLEADASISLQEVLGRKFNLKLLLADRVKNDLLELARGRTIDGVSLDEAAALLKTWDNTVSRDSSGSVLFVTFWSSYREKARPVYKAEWNEARPAATPHGVGDPNTALKSLAAAVRDVKAKYGRLDVRWGEVHRLRRGDLDVPVGGLTGDFGAFRVIGYGEDRDGKFIARGGDSYVMAVEFTSPPTAYSIVAYSQSSDPRSPHYTDQSRLFAREEWKRAWFTEADIAANLERAYRP